MKNLNKIISLQALLKGRNDDFDKTSDKAIQLIRHADARVKKASQNDGTTDLTIYGNPVPTGVGSLYDLYLYYRDLFDKYQSEQKKGAFDGTKYWVVFLGENGTSARLLGIYEIMGHTPSPHKPDEEILDLREVPEFKFLEEKVIIDWGKSTVSWHQYYNNEKEVIRIEEGLTKPDGTPVFKSYLDTILDYDQLQKVLNDYEWIQRLKDVNCIYLVVDKSNGMKYVGSTYNRNGIYGRWVDYAKNGHGNDVELERVVTVDPNHHERYFQWSILEVLPIYITDIEAIEKEGVWKRKLLSLKTQHGYNLN